MRLSTSASSSVAAIFLILIAAGQSAEACSCADGVTSEGAPGYCSHGGISQVGSIFYCSGGTGACAGVTITGCDQVVCSGTGSCHDATIQDTKNVLCNSPIGSCAFVKIYNADTVICTGCGSATIEGPNTSVKCGNGACGSATITTPSKEVVCEEFACFSAKIRAPCLTCLGTNSCWPRNGGGDDEQFDCQFRNSNTNSFSVCTSGTQGVCPATPQPSPPPTPLPTPFPTPLPTPLPTPVPSPKPSPSPTPVPSPKPTPFPTTTPKPTPTPAPTGWPDEPNGGCCNAQIMQLLPFLDPDLIRNDILCMNGPGGFCCSVDPDSEACGGGSPPSATTPNPTPNPTPSPTSDPGIFGEPHLKNWKGDYFSYMGECDLLLLRVPDFAGNIGLDLTIHVRTTIRYDYSFIQTCALRIGDDTLEVSGWGQYLLNDVEGAVVNSRANRNSFGKTNAISSKMGGHYHIFHTPRDRTNKNHAFDIVLPKHQNITIGSMKDIVSVKFHGASSEFFGNVTGFLGSYSGQMLARDGVVDLSDDIHGMADEWQVRPDTDPVLFGAMRAPQYPNKCRLPQNMAMKEARRLGEGIHETTAKTVCGHLLKTDSELFAACVYDVTATNDLDQADAYQ